MLLAVRRGGGGPTFPYSATSSDCQARTIHIMEAQVMLVSTGKAVEGLAVLRADADHKGEEQEPMGLMLRQEAGVTVIQLPEMR